MSTKSRQRRRTTATPTDTTPVPTPKPHLTLVDLRHPLTTRPITGPHTHLELTLSRACLASAAIRLPIPVINWHALPGGRAGAYLRDDTLIVHTAHRAPQFLALVPCRRGLRHQHPVTDLRSLAAARNATAACDDAHSNDDQDQAVVEGVRPAPALKPPAVHPLGEGLHRAAASAEDTQELGLADIAATLPIHTITADDHQPKEHPQP